MKIFREGNQIRFQLMDLNKGIMLFDFKIEAAAYDTLKEHIISHLNEFKP